MTNLQVALSRTIREPDGVVHQSKHRGDQAAVYDAAVKYAGLMSQSVVNWCVPHDSSGMHDTESCDYSLENAYCLTPCRFLDARIVLEAVSK